MFSGGADSTLMYCWYKTNTNLPLSLYIYDRYNNPIVKAIKLYDYLRKRFNDDTSILEIIDLPEMPTYKQTGEAIRLIKDLHDVVIFSGNQYPDDSSIRPKFQQSLIDFNKIKKYDFMYAPLANYDKSDIIKAYYDNKWEDVLSMTHSCGSNTDSPCGECFNCRERVWAYKKLGMMPDMGI